MTPIKQAKLKYIMYTTHLISYSITQELTISYTEQQHKKKCRRYCNLINRKKKAIQIIGKINVGVFHFLFNFRS